MARVWKIMVPHFYVVISLMCLRKMSYVERMQRIIDYRELQRNRPHRTGARIVTTPIIAIDCTITKSYTINC